MKILIDTHALLWMFSGERQLSNKAEKSILNKKNELFFSLASYWEICIKQSLGKLELLDNWQNGFKQELAYNGIRWLHVETDHCSKIMELPFLHRDPFDRLLIAQATCEGMQILTKDKNMAKYKIKTIW